MVFATRIIEEYTFIEMFSVPFLHKARWLIGLAGNHIQIPGVN